MGSVGKRAERLQAVSEGLCTKRKKKKKIKTALQGNFPGLQGLGSVRLCCTVWYSQNMRSCQPGEQFWEVLEQAATSRLIKVGYSCSVSQRKSSVPTNHRPGTGSGVV